MKALAIIMSKYSGPLAVDIAMSALRIAFFAVVVGMTSWPCCLVTSLWQELLCEGSGACDVVDDACKLVSNSVVSYVEVGSVRALRNVLHLWCDRASAGVSFSVSLARMCRSSILRLLQAEFSSYAKMCVAHGRDVLSRRMQP